MDTILRQLPLRTDADILYVHHFTLALAKKAGLSTLEQLGFVCRVTQHCSLAYSNEEEIIFSIHQLDDHYILRAATKKNEGRILVEVPRPAAGNEVEFIKRLTEENTEKAGKSEQDIEQFILTLSHDLKNSIAKIKMAVSLAELEAMTAGINKYIQIISRASLRLENTMQGLNDIIRLGHSAELINNLSPALLFDDVKEDFSELLEDKNATLDINFNGTDQISYVHLYLRSIFSNVVSNAIKYAAPDRALQLTVKSRKEEPYVVFSFTDNGQGIDLSKDGENLFKPFTRFSNQADGSGLGLYLIKNMTERNGGKIEVESEPGKGTSFHFYLREY